MEAMFNDLPVPAHNVVDQDAMLIYAMAQGDIHALDTLYTRYGSMLLGFLILRLDDIQLAEEVLQDVMMAVWEHAATFEARSQVKTWLLAIARNRAINATRKRRPVLVDLNSMFSLQSEDTGPSEVVESHEEQDRVRRGIRLLPDVHREVLELVFYHQLSGAEVAQVLQISEGTVKSRLHRAKETLKRLLMQDTPGGLS